MQNGQNGPTLPPQAYTREILSAAFNWLQTQPESVRKLATTPDALVGLFMRAQRYGASSLENDAPVSAQNFMSDLKNLAEGLKQFEVPRRSAHTAPPSGQYAASQHRATHAATPGTSPGANLGASNSATPGQQAPLQNFNPSVSMHAPNPQAIHPNSSFTQNLHHSATAPELTPRSPVAPNDQLFQHSELTEISQISQISQRTQAMIQEVKGALNLSSDAEVINMMVTLGYKQIKNLLA